MDPINTDPEWIKSVGSEENSDPVVPVLVAVMNFNPLPPAPFLGTIAVIGGSGQTWPGSEIPPVAILYKAKLPSEAAASPHPGRVGPDPQAV